MCEFHIPLMVAYEPPPWVAAKKPPVQILLNESDFYTANALWEDTQDPERGTNFASIYNKRKLGAAIISLLKPTIQNDENGKP